MQTPKTRQIIMLSVIGFIAACSDGDATKPPSADMTADMSVATSCEASTCSGHGACEDRGERARCLCDAGYRGDACAECAPGYLQEQERCVEPPDPCAEVTCERGSCVGGQCVETRVIIAPLFETAGVIVTAPDGQEYAKVSMSIRRADEREFVAAQPLVKYDQHSWAASLFDLTPGAGHVAKLTIERAQGAALILERPFTTRAEVPLPPPTRERFVRDDATLRAALNDATAGDHILLEPGTYSPWTLSNKHGTAAAPIVIRSAQPDAKAIIQGGGGARGVMFEGSSHVVLDQVVVKGASAQDGIGVYLRSSSRITVQRCEITDNGYWNLLVSKSHEFDGPGGWTAGGGHIIQDNVISSSARGDCEGESNKRCPGQVYYGIELNNNPGADMVIRRNTLKGHVDNIVPCGDESAGRDLREDVPHVLAITQDPLPARGRDVPGKFLGHNITVSENVVEDARDDNLEADGVCVNVRFIRNRVGAAQNAITIAPALPGPFYFVRNIIAGDFKEGPVKMNTSGNSAVPTRHVYFFHNTFVRTSVGKSPDYGILNLWYASPGDHNVPIKDIKFENNIFASQAAALRRCTSTSITDASAAHPSFEGNLWSIEAERCVFRWGSDNKDYSFSQWRAQTGQETHGAFAPAHLDASYAPTTASTEVIDKASVIPGVSTSYQGAAPDRGAIELVR